MQPGSYIVKSPGNSRCLILEKETSDSRVVDMALT